MYSTEDITEQLSILLLISFIIGDILSVQYQHTSLCRYETTGLSVTRNATLTEFCYKNHINHINHIDISIFSNFFQKKYFQISNFSFSPWCTGVLKTGVLYPCLQHLLNLGFSCQCVLVNKLSARVGLAPCFGPHFEI